jgi:hypothetical protein
MQIPIFIGDIIIIFIFHYHIRQYNTRLLHSYIFYRTPIRDGITNVGASAALLQSRANLLVTGGLPVVSRESSA